MSGDVSLLQRVKIVGLSWVVSSELHLVAGIVSVASDECVEFREVYVLLLGIIQKIKTGKRAKPPPWSSILQKAVLLLAE